MPTITRVVARFLRPFYMCSLCGPLLVAVRAPPAALIKCATSLISSPVAPHFGEIRAAAEYKFAEAPWRRSPESAQCLTMRRGCPQQ